MREIKFRGKDGDFWVYGSLIKSRGLPIEILKRNTYYDTIVVDPETVGQYTGLLDVVGREIYEGDIVKCGSGRICQVVFFKSDSACCFDLIPVGGFDCKPPKKSTLWKDLTVIGNIHDNLELMEKMK